MRHAIQFGLLAVLLAATPGGGQQVVDRIVARINNDILTASEVDELGAFQMLIEGKTKPRQELVSELIDQWVVAREAEAARFPAPPAGEIDRQLERLKGVFPSPQVWQERLAQFGLTEAAVRRQIQRQVYYADFLDYKFRTSVQVDRAQVESYYSEELVPRLRAEKRSVPSLDEVYEQIRELLTQQGITAKAAQWLDESRTRLRIELAPGIGSEGGNIGGPGSPRGEKP